MHITHAHCSPFHRRDNAPCPLSNAGAGKAFVTDLPAAGVYSPNMLQTFYLQCNFESCAGLTSTLFGARLLVCRGKGFETSPFSLSRCSTHIASFMATDAARYSATKGCLRLAQARGEPFMVKTIPDTLRRVAGHVPQSLSEYTTRRGLEIGFIGMGGRTPIL
jgi:hypothetical protein